MSYNSRNETEEEKRIRLIKECRQKLTAKFEETRKELEDGINKEMVNQRVMEQMGTILKQQRELMVKETTKKVEAIKLLAEKSEKLDKWIEDMKGQPQKNADEMLVPYDKVSEQIIEKYSESLAIDDVLLRLQEAYKREYRQRNSTGENTSFGSIEGYLQIVQALAEKQFQARSHLRKINHYVSTKL